ncbi:MAG: zinc ribbon domain-containing protein [Agathobacter sp.]|nr:zinc ribbon domain-containing protein [Agathobacter sp.]MBQ3559373.1 zinc ribbon domain-containing protein [Agathobacter sp.]
MSTYELIKLLILLLFLVAVGIGIFTVYKNVTRKLRSMSSQLFGTTDFVKGLKMAADVQAETPKSVSAMTRLMEPQIMRDFPEFSWEEFKHKAENMLTSALLAISANNPERLVDASDDIKKQVTNIIEDNRANNVGETYSDIEIHQTEIANYQKQNGKCVITIQSAVGYMYYKMQDGEVIAGDKKRKTQTKYNMELVYIQDVEDAKLDNAVGTTCPQCGAPVKVLGAKYCEYCGSGIVPLNIRVWSLHKFYEVDYN